MPLILYWRSVMHITQVPKIARQIDPYSIDLCLKCRTKILWNSITGMINALDNWWNDNEFVWSEAFCKKTDEITRIARIIRLKMGIFDVLLILFVNAANSSIHHVAKKWYVEIVAACLHLIRLAMIFRECTRAVDVIVLKMVKKFILKLVGAIR